MAKIKAMGSQRNLKYWNKIIKTIKVNLDMVLQSSFTETINSKVQQQILTASYHNSEMVMNVK